MKNELDPFRIYQKVITNEISKFEASQKLLFFLEESEDEKVRIKSIEILNKIGGGSTKTYRIIESCLISDESFYVRAEAVKIILSDFLNIGLNSLRFVIQHEKSSYVLKTLINLINKLIELNYPKIDVLINEFSKRFKKISLLYGITPKEVKFLMDAGMNISSTNLYKLDNLNSFLYDNNIVCVIKNKSIKAVSFSLKYDLPKSIDYLSNLDFLDLSYNNLTSLPNSIINLSRLKTLNLSWNNFNSIPESVLNLASLKVLDLSNNYIEEISNLIHLPASLEKLDLRNNGIQTIPNNIISMNALQLIY